MKKYFIAVFFLSMLVVPRIMYAQSQILINSIEYDVPIINNDLCQGSELSETDWWKRNIETSKRWYFQQALINKAIDGKIKVYDEKGNELSNANLEKLLTTTDTVMMTRKKPPYSFYDTVISKIISPSDIHSLRFKETWYYNPVTYKISKMIDSYSPLISVDKTVNVQNKNKTIAKDVPLFWIRCGENSEEKNMVLLTDFILYNCPVVKNMTVSLPQFGNLVKSSADTSIRSKYIKDLLSDALSLKVKTYFSADFSDYYTFLIDSLQPMNSLEIKEVASNFDTMKSTSGNGDTVICVPRESGNMSMYRFFEKWSFDPNTMVIRKDVIGFTPCEVVFDKTGNFKGIKPLFLVMFGKPIRCFAE